jgi:hypothetical protein
MNWIHQAAMKFHGLTQPKKLSCTRRSNIGGWVDLADASDGRNPETGNDMNFKIALRQRSTQAWISLAALAVGVLLLLTVRHTFSRSNVM